ncbi:MAG: hypothetical protein HQ542_05025, partial [Bacteroidia bacterium]|nr:hypothetical protein [Bacteroidia bacterium]
VYDAGTINTNNPLNNFHAALVVPVGIGAQFRLGDRVNASVEYTFHLVGSDLLDQTVGQSNNDRLDWLAFGVSLNLGKGVKKTIPVYQLPVYNPPPQVRLTARILDPTPPASQEPSPEPPMVTTPAVSQPKTISPPFNYAVQICAFPRHIHTAEWIKEHYRVPMSVRIEKIGNMYRFLVGRCSDLTCAKQLRSQMIRLGIRDAFIVVYQDGVRHHVIRK